MPEVILIIFVPCKESAKYLMSITGPIALMLNVSLITLGSGIPGLPFSPLTAALFIRISILEFVKFCICLQNVSIEFVSLISSGIILSRPISS